MRIKNLQLRARAVVEGFYNGLHRSPFHGFSVEFSEYRPYTPGDDPRGLDWKLYARSDRYFIKRFEDETNRHVYIVLDRSRSMGFGTLEYDKSQYAVTLAATLAMTLSIVLLALWVRHSLRTVEPLVDLRLLQRRSAASLNLSAFLLGISTYLVIALWIQFVQLDAGLGASVLNRPRQGDVADADGAVADQRLPVELFRRGVSENEALLPDPGRREPGLHECASRPGAGTCSGELDRQLARSHVA